MRDLPRPYRLLEGRGREGEGEKMMTRDDVYKSYEQVAFGEFDGSVPLIIVVMIIVFALMCMIFGVFILQLHSLWPFLIYMVIVVASIYFFGYQKLIDRSEENQRFSAYAGVTTRVYKEYIPTLDTVTYPVTKFVLLSTKDTEQGGTIDVKATVIRNGLPVEIVECVDIRFADIEEATLSYHVLDEDLVYGDYIPNILVVRAGEYQPVLTLPKEERR